MSIFKTQKKREAITERLDLVTERIHELAAEPEVVSRSVLILKEQQHLL